VLSVPETFTSTNVVALVSAVPNKSLILYALQKAHGLARVV
jgi:hypothetical protein